MVNLVAGRHISLVQGSSGSCSSFRLNQAEVGLSRVRCFLDEGTEKERKKTQLSPEGGGFWGRTAGNSTTAKMFSLFPTTETVTNLSTGKIFGVLKFGLIQNYFSKQGRKTDTTNLAMYSLYIAREVNSTFSLE